MNEKAKEVGADQAYKNWRESVDPALLCLTTDEVMERAWLAGAMYGMDRAAAIYRRTK